MTFSDVVPAKRSNVYEEEILLKRVKRSSSNDDDLLKRANHFSSNDDDLLKRARHSSPNGDDNGFDGDDENLSYGSSQKNKKSKKNVERETRIKADPDMPIESSSAPVKLHNKQNRQNSQDEKNEDIGISIKTSSSSQDIRKEVFSNSYFMQTNPYESEVQKVTNVLL